MGVSNHSGFSEEGEGPRGAVRTSSAAWGVQVESQSRVLGSKNEAPPKALCLSGCRCCPGRSRERKARSRSRDEQGVSVTDGSNHWEGRGCLLDVLQYDP